MADPARGLRGLQPPVSKPSSAAIVCLSTLISLLLSDASGPRNSVCYTQPLGATPSLFQRAGESLVIAGVLPVLLCILNPEGRAHATPFYSLAERGVAPRG